MASPSSPLRSSLVVSSSVPPVMNDGEYPNWAELPPELISSILHRLGAIEILESAQKVCSSWRRVCKDPSMWRKIDMHNDGDLRSKGYNLEIMCRHAVDRSQGGLLEIDIWYFCTNELLEYISDRASNLRSLKLAMFYGRMSIEAVVKFPLLESLELSYCSVSAESLVAVGQSCPNMKTLKLNNRDYDSDEMALAIAETMPGLCHLQLSGSRLTNTGLNAILDSCLNLEHLDLCQCFNLNLKGDLEKRLSERIKVLKRPSDSTHGYPFDAMIHDMNSSDDDYSYGSSDIDPSDDEYYYDYAGASDQSNFDYDDFYDDLLF